MLNNKDNMVVKFNEKEVPCLIWVDENDDVIGHGEKIDTHIQGVRHRAFSIVIQNKTSGEILIQKRALSKYHSGGLWSNSCCSHPYKEEEWKDALRRAVYDELNLSCILVNSEEIPKGEDEKQRYDIFYKIGAFAYQADYKVLSENEIDHVFLILLDEKKCHSINPNPIEIDSIKWIHQKELKKWMKTSPEDFTAWMGRVMELLESYKSKLK